MLPQKDPYYLLPSHLLSKVPIAFFYSNSFWEGHAFQPPAMLGAGALHRLCVALSGALDRRGIAGTTSRAVVAVIAAGVALLLLMVDPVLAARGTGGPQGRAGVLPGNPTTGQGMERPPFGQAPSSAGNLQPPAGDPGRAAASRLQERLQELCVVRGDSLRLVLEPPSFLVLTGLEEARRKPGGEQEVFGEENEALMLAMQENSRPGEVAFVLDGRLGDLVYAMTGRYATRGMFHEVQTEEEVRPLEERAAADLAVIGGVVGPMRGFANRGIVQGGNVAGKPACLEGNIP